VFYTLNRGASWTQLKANLPSVVVRDLLVHPTAGDLIIGTYGRGAWVGDVSALQQFTKQVEASAFHLFDIHAPGTIFIQSIQLQWHPGRVEVADHFIIAVMGFNNAIAYNSKQFTTAEFFLWGLPASAVLMLVTWLAVSVLWPLMGMEVYVPKEM